MLYTWLYRGEAARKEAAAVAEVAAQQQAVMAAVEAESKQEVTTEPSAFSQVLYDPLVILHSRFLFLCENFLKKTTFVNRLIHYP